MSEPPRPDSGGAATAEKRVRLFVALEVSADALTALLEWREPVLAADRALRAVPRENIHVTLCFLGALAPSSVESVSAAVATAASGCALGGLAFAEAILLPARRPRVLAVRLADPDGGLAELQSSLSRVLADGGWYDPESRAYLPHLTVARARSRARVGLRQNDLPGVPALAVRAASVTLFRSRLGRERARYEPLAEVPVLPAG